MTYQMWRLDWCQLTVKEVTVTRRTPSTVWAVWEGSGDKPIRQPRTGVSGTFFDDEREAWRAAVAAAEHRVELAKSDWRQAEEWLKRVKAEKKARGLR